MCRFESCSGHRETLLICWFWGFF